MSVNITIEGRVAFPSNFIGAVDLDGRDVTVEIESVSQDDIQTERGKASKIVIRFKGKQKAFICNKTNAKMIASVLGIGEMTEWHGHRITLYSTTCRLGAGETDCIRVRNKRPPAKAPDAQVAA